MSKRRGTNKENLEETRKTFLEIAHTEFCEHGYANASTSRIVEKSGMARGSLYYHFGDKNGLFRAVYEDVMQEAMKRISARMDQKTDPWDALMEGSAAFMDLCMQPQFRKILLIESQAAMSFEERFKIQEKTLLAKLQTILPALLKRGYFPGHTGNTIAVFIFGILGEIGRAFDFSQNLEQDRQTYGQAYEKSMACMVQA